MKGVFVNETSIVPNESKDASEATGLENGSGLACTNEFEYFDTLFG